MKRIICWTVTLMILFAVPCSYAEDIDLSGMTINELVELKDRINLAIWNSQEWQEVTVPQGEWLVSEDIPAGTWTVKCADADKNAIEMGSCHIEWGYLDNGYISSYNGGGNEYVYNPDNTFYHQGAITELKVDLKNGMTVRIDLGYAPAVFTPYTGKPSLGFKTKNDLAEEAEENVKRQPIIKDEADLLSDEEEKLLKEQIESISEYCTPIFWSTDAEDSQKNVLRKAESFVKSVTDSEECVAFVIDMHLRRIAIYSTGSIYGKISTTRANTIIDDVYLFATNGEYYECAKQAFQQILQVLNGTGL